MLDLMDVFMTVKPTMSMCVLMGMGALLQCVAQSPDEIRESEGTKPPSGKTASK